MAIQAARHGELEQPKHWRGYDRLSPESGEKRGVTSLIECISVWRDAYRHDSGGVPGFSDSAQRGSSQENPS